MSKPIVPITRLNKFFSSRDFELEQNMGREAIEGDGNFTVILYRVDRNLTESDNIYGEASKDGIKYLPPIELKVHPILAETENIAYNKNAGTLQNNQIGLLKFGVYNSQLDDLNVSISYGDYIGYPVTETVILYFVVTNDGSKQYDNRHTIMGYKPAFKSITCAPVDSSEFSAV